MTTLTPHQWAIVSHRLGAADAIAECFADDPDLPPAAAEALRDQVRSRANEIEHAGRHGLDVDNLPDLDREIIVDCCEGCTLFAGLADAVALGEVSRGQALNLHKAATELERLFGCYVPRD